MFFSLSDPRFLFYVNLAIKEIIKKDTHEYEWKMQDEEKRKQKQKQNWKHDYVHSFWFYGEFLNVKLNEK